MRSCLKNQNKIRISNCNHIKIFQAEKSEALKKLESIEFNESSSKVNAALKEMIRIRDEAPTDKMIIVSQFTSFLSMIQPIIADNGFKFVRLDGSMSHMDRTEAVNLFQKKTASSPNVMLLSLKAGGVGLNLTAANHILLLDPAWNPAAEWQCFDRAHRIGQEKDVHIYKFITYVSAFQNFLTTAFMSFNNLKPAAYIFLFRGGGAKI